MKPKDSDFQIDPFNLDQEWIKQADTFRKYSEASADAKRAFDEAKNALSVVRAETDLAVRNDPGSYGIAKVTEGLVKAAVEVFEEVVKAEQDVVDAKFVVNMLDAAIGSLDHKKRALSDLVSLHLRDYYSEPVARDGAKEVADTMVKQKARQGKRRRRSDDD